jgi:quercetin dioxygenase-like cupin family protein
MRQVLYLLCTIAVFAVPSVMAQDAAKVDPDHYKVEFENSRVRVLRAKVGPHQKSLMHSHPDAVIVVLSGGKTKFTLADGKTEEMDLATGDTRWTPAVVHQGENMSDQELEVIVIELKRATAKKHATKKPATANANKQ